MGTGMRFQCRKSSTTFRWVYLRHRNRGNISKTQLVQTQNSFFQKAGISDYLKEQNHDIQIWAADPPGSVIYDYVISGNIPDNRSGSSVTEGIGQGRITENLKNAKIDNACRIPDDESIKMLFQLIFEEGLSVGLSSALNVCAAVKMAESLGKGSTVVTILCDGVSRICRTHF